MRAGLLLVLACALAAAPSAAGARTIAIGYDGHFRSAAAHWLPTWDWRYLKAQCVAESALNPQAVSPVGAQGLCQFMPRTFDDVRGALNWPATASPFAAELAIEAAAYYDAQLRATWSAPRSEDDRRRLTLASYNAGAGNILAAQRRCFNARTWPAIAPCLVQVTGPINARETTGYVARIEAIFLELTL